jgi:pimeloyl-ACP methyl ester carboxylesterase
MHGEEDTFEMAIGGVRRGAWVEEGYEPVTLETSRGEVELRHYAPGARRAVVYVGGVGGGWDSPVGGRLYPELCAGLAAAGIGGLRVRFRYPTVLEEAILDVLAALLFLKDEGVTAAGVVGHSFGGAVAAQAAAHSDLVRVLVTLATQAYGVDVVSAVSPGCASLFVHGAADTVLPPACSRHAFELAPEPRRLVVCEGAGHALVEAGAEVHREVRDWIAAHLATA